MYKIMYKNSAFEIRWYSHWPYPHTARSHLHTRTHARTYTHVIPRVPPKNIHFWNGFRITKYIIMGEFVYMYAQFWKLQRIYLSQIGRLIPAQPNFHTLYKSEQCSPKHELFSNFLVSYKSWVYEFFIHIKLFPQNHIFFLRQPFQKCIAFF